ncbi:Geranylgeranyl pyrophosphate synthase [Thermoplasmatales archaeon BRNA1]|nr:Geranylgeranyl pyrophosphate synthase [Thermoplasmatales archaeon BRNA1]
MDAKDYLKKTSAEVDGPMKSYIPDEEPMRLIEASRQYPYAGGKRMRPAIVLAACGAVGGDKKKAMPLAVAIEYIHNFTLIHDDLMDGDEMRRGMKTIHVGYDEPTAILAGDALFAKAFQIIAELDIPAEAMREVLRFVTKAVWDLARGQEMDILNEGKLIDEAHYTETIFLKTSVLFAAAAAGGALCGGADKKVVDAINRYALDMGLGFQMFDDYLGIAGDTSKTGKSVGNDLRKGKCTLMVTYTLEHLKDEKKLAKFKSILGNMKATEAEVREGMEIMREIGAIEYNKKAAEDKIASAKAYLDILPPSDDKDFMLALADYAINREV